MNEREQVKAALVKVREGCQHVLECFGSMAAPSKCMAESVLKLTDAVEALAGGDFANAKSPAELPQQSLPLNEREHVKAALARARERYGCGSNSLALEAVIEAVEALAGGDFSNAKSPPEPPQQSPPLTELANRARFLVVEWSQRKYAWATIQQSVFEALGLERDEGLERAAVLLENDYGQTVLAEEVRKLKVAR